MAASDVESLTQQYGLELFARLRKYRPLMLSPRWWDERMMRWGMDNESLKVQLFRFVDVLPMMRSPGDTARHLREYLAQADAGLRPILRLGRRCIPQTGLLARAVAGAARVSTIRLAHRFVAGADVEQTLGVLAAMREQSLAFTIDLLGEAVLTEEEADSYQAHYLRLADGLTARVNGRPEVPIIDRDSHGPLPRVNISIKLSSLYSQWDPIDPEHTCEAVKARLRPILRKARAGGAFINVDMEKFANKDVTLRIFQEVFTEPEFRDWPHVGLAIQAYLRSCGDDLAGLVDWAKRRGTPVWVRLVKGAYWDYETTVAAQNGWPTPVYTNKWESDASFERHARFIIEHRDALRLAIGSHNVRSIAHTLALARQHDLPPREVEFQVLFGMADEIKAALVGLGQRVRVYTPYGELLPGMAYLVRRLLENTANESFLRASFAENVPKEQLLMNPLKAAARRPASPPMDRQGAGEPTPFANEPPTDFSREPARQAMQEALRLVAGQIGRDYSLVIDGKAVPTARTAESLNPSHRCQVVGRCAQATPELAERAIAAAHAAFPAWRDTPPPQRAEYLFRTAQIMRRRRFELAAWEVYECAKQWREADGDVTEAIDFCEYYGREMIRSAVPRRRDLPGEENENFYEPRGVAVVLAPWNFPLAILCGMTAAALVTGNTAIMKPAGQSPIIAAKLMDIFREAGFPPGVVHYLPGPGRQIGPVLVGHRDVAVIAFTGSRSVGLEINELAAQTPAGQNHIKRVINELGGKNAIIVDDDADLDEAVHGITSSAFGYQGQKCSACSRVIALAGVYDALLDRLVGATRSLRIGPAEEPGCFVGPVIDESARQAILGYIEQGKQEARLVYAGELGALADEGFYVAPHVFADVPPTAVIAQEEIFGPVLSVMKARDLNEALEIANGTSYALTGGFYSRSPAHIARVRREFHVGNLYVNRKITGALVDRQPFGGFKLSGVGSKAGGPDYLLQFMVPRTVCENTMRHGFAPSLAAAEERQTSGGI